MSLSTLLEAAKYLDFLDSNNQQQQHQQHQFQMQFQSNQPQSSNKRSTGRRRISKKNAANTMVAMSLPASTRPIQVHGVPIPVVSHGSGGESHQTASLSSSFTTGSPLSSFASTALFCSKASGVTSASSSAASSLSSSDTSSSCGEILMGDNDFTQTLATTHGGKQSNNNQMYNTNISYNNHHNYHLSHQQSETNNHRAGDQSSNSMNHHYSNSGGNNHHIARYIAATSAGPQLVTMTTSSALASTSAPVDGSIRAGHVIHAATNHTAPMNASGTSGTGFDAQQHRFSLTTNSVQHHQTLECHEGQSFNIGPGGSSFGSDNHLSTSPGSSGPLIMTRVQPMILNSLSPASTQSIMAFQPATASSPTSSSFSYSRHRELHKTLEKNRRAHLRHCFELLKAELPASECVDKKTSHINIIKSAIRYVLALRQQECEIENELQRVTKIKTELTENLSKIRKNEPIATTAVAIPPNPSSTPLSSPNETKLNQEQQQQQQKQQQSNQQQPPVAEQQLSFLLSQSKID